ncbi:MAG: protein kinase [Myxococcota bacterium]
MRKNLGKYRLIAEIGRGGMASVYLAVSRGPGGFNKLVVIKAPKLDAHQDGEIVTMFLDEARLAARLNHPNVVQTYEVGVEEDRPFIAMEYLEGQALWTWGQFSVLCSRWTKLRGYRQNLREPHD